MTDPIREQIFRSLRPIKQAPTLKTVNGIGFRLQGSLGIPGETKVFVAAYWLVILFLPLIPTGLYVVSITVDPSLAELLTLWPHLSDDARQSLLRIARAKVALGAGGWLERPAPRMKGAGR